LAGKWFQRDPCSRIKVLKLEDGINVLQPGVTGSKMDEAHTGCDQRFEFPSVSQRACNLYKPAIVPKRFIFAVGSQVNLVCVLNIYGIISSEHTQ